MERTKKPGSKRVPRKSGAKRGRTRNEDPQKTGLPQDRLTARAKEGDEGAFLSLVRFHSTFNPIPITPELLLTSGIDDITRGRLSGRLQRKEDRLLRPFPGIDMMFWGEDWVQETLRRFLWRKRGGRTLPNGAFLKRLWDASREGATLQLRIYRKAYVAPAAWIRVKAPHFVNLGLTDAQMLRIARAEGCRFGEKAFLSAVRRFRKTIP